jgi:hypothetical protein
VGISGTDQLQPLIWVSHEVVCNYMRYMLVYKYSSVAVFFKRDMCRALSSPAGSAPS